MPTTTNPVFDDTYSCQRQTTKHVATYTSPCNWAEYPIKPDGLPSDIFGFLKFMYYRADTTLHDAGTAGGPVGFGVRAIIGGMYLFIMFLTLGRASILAICSKMWPVRQECDTDKYKEQTAIRDTLSGFTGWFFGVPDALKASLDKRVSYGCPTEIIGPGEMNAARLRGFLDKDQWEFGLKLNNQLPDWQERAYLAQQTVFTIPEIMRLWCSGVITKESIPNWCRANGVLDSQIVDGYKYLYEVTPTASQCFASLLTNREDGPTDDLFGLSADFDDRMTPQLELWLRKAGYTPTMQKFLWRQQRELPSYRMIGQLYVTGQIEESDLVTAFNAMGFTAKVSGWMADMIKAGSRARKAALEGKPSLSELETQYITGTITYEEYSNALFDQGYDVETTANLINRSDRRSKVAEAKYALSWMQRAFIHGRMSYDQATSGLATAGIAMETAIKIVGRWNARKTYGDKSLSLSQLCSLVASGHLPMADYMTRAGNLGWDLEQAALLAQSCNEKIAEQRQRAINKQQADELRRAEKIAAATRKEAKRQAKLYKDRFPCKPKAKPACPAGVDYPPAVVAASDA